MFNKLKKILLPWHHDSMLYEVTTRCNIKCTHCYNVWKGGDHYPTKEFNTEEALGLIDKAITQSRCKNFTFTGGEPLLRSDLEILIQRASSKCESINLITNGTLLTEDRVQSLIKSGVTLFELPLNSGDRELHNQMAGDIDCFDKVLEAAANIRYHGAQLAFVFVATKQNISQWQNALELGIALGASGFLFNRYNAGGCGYQNPEQLMPSVSHITEALAIAEEYSVKYNVGIGASIALPPCLISTDPYPHVGFGFCAAGTDRAYYTIDPVGNIRPCNHTPTILGNLMTSSLKEIVRFQELKSFMEARPDFCKGCTLEKECQGGCKAAAEVCYGSLTRCEPFLELNKIQAEMGKMKE